MEGREAGVLMQRRVAKKNHSKECENKSGVNNTYLAQHRPNHRTKGPPISTTLRRPLHMLLISIPTTLVGGMWLGHVAGTEEATTFSRAVDLLRREQNETGDHTSHTSNTLSMVPGTEAGTNRDADKEMRIRKLVDVEELGQPELLGDR